MVQCPSCRRHHRAAEADCPFCRRPAPFQRAMGAIGGAVTTVVLAACYGAPGGRDTGPFDTNAATTGDTAPPQPDADGDGFRADRDCDEANSAINPGADEICDDGVDNDCDGLIDAADPECPAP